MHDLVTEAKNSIIGTGFGKQMNVTSAPGEKWTKIQLWKTMQKISESTRVSYNDLLSIFEGNNEAIYALVCS